MRFEREMPSRNWVLSLVAVILLAACSSSSGPEGGTAVANTPATGGGPTGGAFGAGGNPAPVGGMPSSGGSAVGDRVSGAGGGQMLGTAGNGGSAAGGSFPIGSGGVSMTSAGGAAGVPTGTGGMPPIDPDSVSVKMDDFTVAPGAEVFMCQDFDNPFGGADVAIGRSESTMTTGSHHLHVYYGADTPSRTVAPCPDPNEFRPMIHLATVPHLVSEYPSKMAAKLKGQTGLRMQVHYLNTSIDELHAQVALKLTKVDPAKVEKWVAQMHFNRTAMQIAQGSGQVLTTSCSIPSTFGPIGLLSAVSHMHRRGVHFVAATSTGTPLFDTTEWDEAPPVIYDPPVMVNPGESIKWTCTYDNDTGMVLTFGDSAVKNEMCIYIARFFSSPNGDDLTCETPYSTSVAKSASAPDQ
jgi:hypothetical protein